MKHWFDLKAPLKAMNVTEVFEQTANFSSFSDALGLHLGEIGQQSTFEVRFTRELDFFLIVAAYLMNLKTIYIKISWSFCIQPKINDAKEMKPKESILDYSKPHFVADEPFLFALADLQDKSLLLWGRFTGEKIRDRCQA